MTTPGAVRTLFNQQQSKPAASAATQTSSVQQKPMAQDSGGPKKGGAKFTRPKTFATQMGGKRPGVIYAISPTLKKRLREMKDDEEKRLLINSEYYAKESGAGAELERTESMIHERTASFLDILQARHDSFHEDKLRRRKERRDQMQSMGRSEMDVPAEEDNNVEIDEVMVVDDDPQPSQPPVRQSQPSQPPFRAPPFKPQQSQPIARATPAQQPSQPSSRATPAKPTQWSQSFSRVPLVQQPEQQSQPVAEVPAAKPPQWSKSSFVGSRFSQQPSQPVAEEPLAQPPEQQSQPTFRAPPAQQPSEPSTRAIPAKPTQWGQSFSRVPLVQQPEQQSQPVAKPPQWSKSSFVGSRFSQQPSQPVAEAPLAQPPEQQSQPTFRAPLRPAARVPIAQPSEQQSQPTFRVPLQPAARVPLVKPLEQQSQPAARVPLAQPSEQQSQPVPRVPTSRGSFAQGRSFGMRFGQRVQPSQRSEQASLVQQPPQDQSQPMGIERAGQGRVEEELMVIDSEDGPTRDRPTSGVNADDKVELFAIKNMFSAAFNAYHAASQKLDEYIERRVSTQKS